MSGFNYLINLTVVNGGAFGKLATMAGGFESKLDAVQGELGQTEKKLDKLGSKGQSVFNGLRSSVGGWIAGLGIAAAALGSLSTTADISSIDTAITFAGGKEGAANLAFIDETVARLNTPIMAAKEGFKILSGSMIGTNIDALEQRKIFDSVAVASRVMGLSAENTTGAILALGQMASKGKVQAEELRGQLGERIPGAFGIAARAMGVTTRELDKMMQQGKLVAEDFLPKFAAEMQRTFGPGLEAAMNSPRAQFDKFSNSVIALKETIGTQLMPTATALINNVFVPLVTWVGKNIEVLGFLATVIGGLYLAVKAYNIVVGIQTLLTTGFTGAVWALNAAFYANPIGFIIAAVIAIGAAVVYAWNKFEGFRGFIFGMWEVIKEWGSMLFEFLIQPFMSFGKIVAGIFTFDGDMIASGITDAVKVAESFTTKAGERLGGAFDRGWNDGIASFASDNPAEALVPPSAAPGGLGGAKFNQPGATGGKKEKEQAKELSSSITGGGQRNITIQIGKLTGVETLHTVNMKEGADRVGEELLKKLLQVINGANQMQNG